MTFENSTLDKMMVFLKQVFLPAILAMVATAALMAPGIAAEPPKPVETVPVTPFDAPPGTWTLAVLPDTQYYSYANPEVYTRQTEWLAANWKRHNIRFVLHEGDITQQNTVADWEKARKAMDVLNKARIPYALVPGNHDYGIRGRATGLRETLLNQYFHPSDYKNNAAVGYFETGKLENTWHTFNSPSGEFLVLALELFPRDIVLDWANKVVAQNPGKRVIVLTHAYLRWEDIRSDYGWDKWGRRNAEAPPTGFEKPGAANNGEQMWEKFVSWHANIEFVLCGHDLGDGTGYIVSPGIAGNRVHQILANYQKPVHNPYGGGGYLRLMQFLPDGKTVRVKTYSPWYDQWRVEPDQQFDITLGKVKETQQTTQTPPVPIAGTRVEIPTSRGRGADSLIDQPAAVKPVAGQPAPQPEEVAHGGDPTIQAKTSRRKIYLRFDLDNIEPSKVVQARLVLTVAKFEGFEGNRSPLRFRVYGIEDGETGDGQTDWSERDLRWSNAPQNDTPVSTGPATVFIEEIEVDTALKSGEAVEFKSPKLLEFLKRDKNRLVTLVILRHQPKAGGNTVFFAREGKQGDQQAPKLDLTVN